VAKRGPKRHKVKRFPSGQIKRAASVEPTSQLIAKRVARLVIAGVDPEKSKNLANTGLRGPEQENYFRLAESWLGVLYAAGVIDSQLFKAGDQYHQIYKACLPQGFAVSSLDPDVAVIHGEAAQDYAVFNCAESIVEAWAASEKVLAGVDRRTHALVKNICIYGRFERFIDTSSPRPIEAWNADRRDRTRFVCGLDALALAYGYKAAQQETRRAA
jgi:hypothetical protein